MKSTAARKLTQVLQGYLVIGGDAHRRKHAAVVMTQNFTIHSKFKFSNSREGFDLVLERARMEMVRTMGCRAKTWYPLQGPKRTETSSSIIGTTNLILSSMSIIWDLR